MEKPVIKAALLQFKNKNYNFVKYFRPEDEDQFHYRNYREMHPVLGCRQEQECRGIRFMSAEVRQWNQDQVKKYLDKYFKDLKDKGVDPFCSDIRPLGSWLIFEYDTFESDWEITDEFVTDMYENKLNVYNFHGKKLVLIKAERTNLWIHLGQKVRGCNNSQYGLNKPVKIVGNSYYNKNDELIFWYDEAQRKKLQEEYDSENGRKKAWEEWEKVKSQVNNTTFTPIPYVVAEEFLECVPPKRMDSGRWLVGEAYDHNAEGQALYLECRRVVKGKWEAKYTTVSEFDKK